LNRVTMARKRRKEAATRIGEREGWILQLSQVSRCDLREEERSSARV